MKITKYDLVMEKVTDFPESREIRDAEDAVDFLCGGMNLNVKAKEHLETLALNSKGDVIGVNETSVGALTCTPANARDIFQFALLSNACSIIIAHNHPSGDPAPSDQDIEVTKHIMKAGEILGIKVQDHLIIGDHGYTSMRGCGYMD